MAVLFFLRGGGSYGQQLPVVSKYGLSKSTLSPTEWSCQIFRPHEHSKKNWLAIILEG